MKTLPKDPEDTIKQPWPLAVAMDKAGEEIERVLKGLTVEDIITLDGDSIDKEPCDNASLQDVYVVDGEIQLMLEVPLFVSFTFNELVSHAKLEHRKDEIMKILLPAITTVD
jgi:hypothetical protein